jgi:F0F1-type ATP synthase membrane subunit c/vacuolar-type H+-ATPase subunit K
MSIPNNWGDWRPNLTPHTGDLQATDLIECTMIVGGVPVNTAITGQQIIDAASGGGAAGYYAMYQDNITQTAAVINTGYPIKFRTLDYSNGVSVVSDSRITIANTGIYNLQFSVQLENSSTQEHDVTIWLRKNGTDVAGSSGFVSVASSHGGVHGHVLSAWNYLLDVIGGEYYELVWSTSNTAVTMPYYPGALPPPSAASAIFTVTQQSGIIAGTGMTALNGLSGAVQTISTGTTGTDFNVVSSGTDHKFNIPTASATNRGALSNTDWSTFNAKQPTLVSGTNIKTINSTSLLGSGDIVIGGGGLTVGTTAIASGTIGGILFQNGSNLLAQDPALFWDNTNKRLGVGATPASTVRLDVRAQGALSTDLAFRVRNSANTRNIISVQGDETITLGATTNANTKLSISGSPIGVSSNATLVGFSATINPATSINAGAFGGFVRVSVAAPSGNYYGLNTDIDSGNANTNLYAVFGSSHGSGTNYGGYFRAYGGTSNHALYVLDGDMRFGATTTNKIGFWNRTPILQPTTAVAAATFVVGVGTAVTDASTFDGYTLGQIARALRNMGILA